MSTRLTEAQMRALADELLDAYNRHDVDALLPHYTDDVVWTEPTLPAPARGRREVAAALKDTFTAFPDLHVGTEDFALYPDVEGQSGVVTWSLTGTMTGAMSNGVPATGRSVAMSGANVARFRDGLICEYTFHYDSLAMMQQLGMLPKSTGIGFKAIVMADVAAARARKVLQRH
ncbi:MAG: ester cyclase [Terrabacter sp.]